MKSAFLIYLALFLIETILASTKAARTFVGYNVYKGKAAMAIKPVAPVFNELANGNRILSKDGGMLLEIAPISGVREYDWTKKATFLLDPSECGEILCFHDMKASTEVGFLHDTFMGGAYIYMS
jgi:hypothetical protein